MAKLHRSLALLAMILGIATASPAFAAGFHYASSTNRIYVEDGGSATLSDIKAAMPSAPLDLVSPGVWHLRANIQIEDGTTLVLHGTAVGGDVDELRIKSDTGSNAHVQITADYGNIDIDSTRITSWNAEAGGPDTEYATGRAFIRVRSKLGPDGVTPLESRMDIIDSEISHLGYNAAESYGLVWKVNGYTGSNDQLFDQVQVRGNIMNSHIHHNYYGVYTFGHQDGLWTDNEVNDNVGYGFDPHDDTDDLLIEGNNVHHNGNHGIIASKRCDHVTIRNNVSSFNVGNGIMLHRSSNDGLVEGNTANDNTDSGVAIFASARSVIRNNTLLRNASSGIRMSMGASDSQVTNNEIGFSGKYGFYFYRGSDTPEPNDDGRPKRNTFQGNTIHDVASDGIKMTDGDNNLFIDNTFTAIGTRFNIATSRATELTNNTIPTNVVVTLSGTSSVKSTLTAHIPFASLKINLKDANSTVQFRDSARAVFDPDENLFSGVTSSSSLLSLTQAAIGSTTTVVKRNLVPTPSGMTVYVSPKTWTSTSRAWQARGSNASGSVRYQLGDLVTGTQYRVQQGATDVGTFTADSAGRITFTVTPGTTSTLTYTVNPL
jgi:parallel beta-helix repeat protein